MILTSKHTDFSTLYRCRYRYGFQGQEKDDEVSGTGNSYTAQFWQYDSRIARRWNIDPVVKPHESPYVAFSNNPIWFVDPNGADTLDFVAANKQMKKLSQTAKELEKEKSWIKDRISDYEKNVQMVKDIEINHKMSVLTAKGSKSSIPGMVIEGLNMVNGIGIEALKGKLIELASAINNDIENYNKSVEYYEGEKSLMQLELASVEYASAYYDGGNSIVTVPRNYSEIPAAIHYKINSKSYRFGKTNEPGKRIYITLPKIQKVDVININKLTIDMLESALKSTSKPKK